MESLNRPNIFEINMLYLILGVLLIFGGYFVQSRDIYSGLLITEYIIILLPNILYLRIKKYSIKEALKFNRISFKQISFTILIMIFSYPTAVFLNLIAITVLSNFAPLPPPSVPIPTSSGEYFLGLFVIALAPGICEEIMFRGTMMLGYDKMGYKKSILITAILFGIFHFNAMNLLGPIFLGIILGLLVHRTNSILSSMVAHTINNGIALTISYLLTKYGSNIDQQLSSSPAITEQMQIMISLILFGVLTLISIIVVVFLFKHMPKTNQVELLNDQGFEGEYIINKETYNSLSYTPLLIVFIAFIFLNSRLLF